MAEAGSVANGNGGTEEETTETKIKDGVQLSEMPQKVLLIIFARLDLPSKKNVVQVCKKWRDVAYDKVVWKNVYVNVDLDRITNKKVFASFETRGIQRIEVNNLTELSGNLRIMFRSMPSLRELKIMTYYNVSDRNLNYLHKFKHLRSLELHDAYTITNETLKVVGRSLKELTTLTLWACHQITDEGIKYLTGSDGNSSIEGSLKIKNLCLPSCQEISDESLKMIATKLLELTKLELQYCNRITDIGITFLAGGTELDKVPGNHKLEEINLCNIGGITELCLQKMAEGLPFLKTLILSDIPTWTEVAFTHLGKMTCLETLKMSNCSVMDGWLAHIVEAKIRILCLDSNEAISTEGLRHISGMSHLQELILSSCGVDDEGLKYLSHCPSMLTFLDLTNNNKITDIGMVHLANMAHLKILDLSMCQNITSVGFLQLSQLASPTLTLKCLQNFQNTYERFNQFVRNVDEKSMGCEEWLKAVRKISEMEKMLELHLQPAA